jgi:hypothetical protein
LAAQRCCGWLRRNGVPYSDKATVTEFFDWFPVPNDGQWFMIVAQADPSDLRDCRVDRICIEMLSMGE